MRKIDWKDAYSVGVKIFDEQHKEIVDYLNKMFVIIDQNSQQDQLKDLFTKIDEYAQVHFTTEEGILNKFKYHDLEGHKEEHQIYIAKMETFRDRLISTDEHVSEDILGFLADWWMGHIQGCDKEYTRFLNNCGVF
ncbi:MAG: hypothetical protein C0410_04005 [Anaerolinea sp.]|nr:hypothetical protein [Anaerolinea sp.]